MNPDDSPFTPNQPVSPEFFVGRKSQIDRLIGVVRQARKSLQVAWIGGERGMGKSSIASFVRIIAERDYNALVAHVHLGGVHDLSNMVRQAYLDLIKDNQRESVGRKMVDFFGDKVEQVGLFGTEIKLNLSPEDLNADARSFAESLNQLRKQSGKSKWNFFRRFDKSKEMVLLVLDDINGLVEAPAFADWIKSMVDSMATRGLDIPVCLIFVGLPERLEKLKSNNPSVARAFRETIDIQSWENAETVEFFRNAFAQKDVEINTNFLEFLAMYSGGIPTVAHEIGEQAWRLIEGNNPSSRTAVQAIANATRLIGTRFIEKDVMQALGSDNYKSILNKIGNAGNLIGVTFKRKDLVSLASLNQAEKNVLDNFLRRMVRVGGLLSDGHGTYRFPTALHRLYFGLTARPPTK